MCAKSNYPTAFADQNPSPYSNPRISKEEKLGKYQALFGGLFKEVFEQQATEECRHFVFDTKTKKLKSINTAVQENELIDPVAFAYDFGARMYDARLGKFLSVDPDYNQYPYSSPFLFASNNPIRYIDIKGKGPGDKVIIFSGAILFPGFQEPSPTMFDILNSVNNHTGQSSLVYSIYLLNDKTIIENNVQDIKDWRAANPTGELAIVGYSYGGVLAMKLTRELDKLNIPVDLLITLDAANGNKSNEVDRAIPDNVKKNINYYEQNSSGSAFADKVLASKGDKNVAIDPDKTKVININETQDKINDVKVNHYNIDDDCVEDVCNEVKTSQDPD